MQTVLNLKRCKGNPVLGPIKELPWANREARNPGVVFDGEKFHLLFTARCRAHTGLPYSEDGGIYLGYASSGDGVRFDVSPEPFLKPDPELDSFDHAHVEDARITYMEGKYYISYMGRSYSDLLFAEGKRRKGPNGNMAPAWNENFRRAGFAWTNDWKNVTRLGPCTSEHACDANVVLLPEKVNGKYAILHRPTFYIPWILPAFYHRSSIWMAFNDSLGPLASDLDAMPWEYDDSKDVPDDHLLIESKFDWEWMKVGASGVPIPTDDGWLMIYHGVDRRGVYRVGLMLLDRENPLKVIARSPLPILQPEEDYERLGEEQFHRDFYYPYCVFPCANLLIDDEIWIYYGAGDKYCCLATMKLREAMDYLHTADCRNAAND